MLFIISFFASSFAVEFVQYFQSYVPTFLSKLADSYTSVDALERTWSGFGWIPILFKKLVLIYLTVLVFLFIKSSKEIKQNKKIKDLYLFLLVWMSVFNFLMIVPSLGGRFIQLSFPIIAYIWLVAFKDYKYQRVILIFPLVFFWNILQQFLYYIEVLSPGFYFSSPFYLLYKHILISWI